MEPDWANRYKFRT